MSDTLPSGDMLVSESSEQEIPCQLQMFLEMEAANPTGYQTPRPLFISCPCKRCSPFTL